MSKEENTPLYPTPEHHPHYQDIKVDHTGDQGGNLPPGNKPETIAPPAEPTVRIENILLKGKKAQRITLNEGTRDEIKLTGRVYGLRPGVIVRNMPAEVRDSQIVGESAKENSFFFKVNGHDRIENGIAYFWGFLGRNNGIGNLPTLIVSSPVVVAKNDVRGDSKKR